MKLSSREVEERLVEAMLLWRRTPGSGFGPGRASPFATDGPWNLLTLRARAGSEFDARGVAFEAGEADKAAEAAGRASASASDDGPRGLDHGEVRRRDQASEWLGLVGEDDRALLLEVVWQRAFGHGRLDWARVMRRIGVARGRDGLRMRYVRVLERLADKINCGALAAI